MGLEIERKFLVVGDRWRADATGSAFRQGYLSTAKERTVRVRVVDGIGLLTVKGTTVGATRAEFEYEIPVAEARVLLDELCEHPLIEKTRHVVANESRTWTIDEFDGANAGLVVAEIELEHPDEPINFPAWVGSEVTHDPRYYNANLVAFPFSSW